MIKEFLKHRIIDQLQLVQHFKGLVGADLSAHRSETFFVNTTPEKNDKKVRLVIEMERTESRVLRRYVSVSCVG